MLKLRILHSIPTFLEMGLYCCWGKLLLFDHPFKSKLLQGQALDPGQLLLLFFFTLWYKPTHPPRPCTDEKRVNVPVQQLLIPHHIENTLFGITASVSLSRMISLVEYKGSSKIEWHVRNWGKCWSWEPLWMCLTFTHILIWSIPRMGTLLKPVRNPEGDPWRKGMKQHVTIFVHQHILWSQSSKSAFLIYR